MRRDGNEIIGSCSRELDSELPSWQLADDGGIERIQLRAENLAVTRNLYVCCSTVIFGACSYSITVIAPVLKSVTRKRLVESVTDSGH
jgi:hypothetical protein